MLSFALPRCIYSLYMQVLGGDSKVHITWTTGELRTKVREHYHCPVKEEGAVVLGPKLGLYNR